MAVQLCTAEPGHGYPRLDAVTVFPFDDEAASSAVRDTLLDDVVLGEHLTDRKLAKAARKAAMRRRSWMADRR